MRSPVIGLLIAILLANLVDLSCSAKTLQPAYDSSPDSGGSGSATPIPHVEAIPADCGALAVYLDVSLPADRSNQIGQPLEVHGFVNKPDASVTVNETEVLVNSDGSFSSTVRLAEGNNLITADAVLDGQTDTALETVLVTATDMTLPPGQGLAYLSQVLLPQSTEIRAGETKTAEITFESRKGMRSPTEIAYEAQLVAAEYSTKVLPLPVGLDIVIEPSRFVACPNSTYRSSLHIGASASLTPGDYWLLFRRRSGTGSGGTTGWIRIEVLPR